MKIIQSVYIYHRDILIPEFQYGKLKYLILQCSLKNVRWVMSLVVRAQVHRSWTLWRLVDRIIWLLGQIECRSHFLQFSPFTVLQGSKLYIRMFPNHSEYIKEYLNQRLVWLQLCPCFVHFSVTTLSIFLSAVPSRCNSLFLSNRKQRCAQK